MMTSMSRHLPWAPTALVQKKETGLHWNRVARRNMMPVTAVMAMADLMIHTWAR